MRLSDGSSIFALERGLRRLVYHVIQAADAMFLVNVQVGTSSMGHEANSLSHVSGTLVSGRKEGGSVIKDSDYISRTSSQSTEQKQDR